MKRCSVIFLIFCICSTGGFCQDLEDPAYISELNPSYAEQFTGDLVYLAKTPFRWNNSDALKLAGLTAVTAGLMISLDYPVHEQFHDRESYAATDGINTLTAPGRLYDVVDPHLFILGSSALMMGSGALFQNSKLTDTGFTALEAVFFSAMTTNFLKLVAGRGRPLYNGSNDSFDPMSFEAGNLERSFPSGHTTKAFAFATVIASSYDSPWVKIPSYALAGSVALQRIESGSHWISDVFAGAAIGYFVGKSLAQRNGLTDKPAKLTPIVKGGQLGLNVRF